MHIAVENVDIGIYLPSFSFPEADDEETFSAKTNSISRKLENDRRQKQQELSKIIKN